MIAVIGTLDTKGEEIKYIEKAIKDNRYKTVTIDIGIFDSDYKADITNKEVAEAAGSSIDEVRNAGEFRAMEVMGEGLSKILRRLKVEGAIAIGGGTGLSAACKGMRSLPLGTPKVVVSTLVLAQSPLKVFTGSVDVTVFISPADFVGLNRLTKKVLKDAANTISMMVNNKEKAENGCVATTTMGTVNGLANSINRMLRRSKFDVVAFHTVGLGGEAFERFVKENNVIGVIDLSLNEIGNTLFGGLFEVSTRLEAAREKGIPQVIIPGNVEFIVFGDETSIPTKYRKRKKHKHHKSAVTVKLEASELEQIALFIAKKLKNTKNTCVIIPTEGFSAFNYKGGIFYDPEANRRFIETLKENLNCEVMEIKAHINDEDFAKVVVEKFFELVNLGDC